MDKAKQRSSFRHRRDNLSEQVREANSYEICKNLKKLFDSKQVDAYLAYYPLGSEASLVAFMEEVLLQQKELALPRTLGEDMTFYVISSLDQVEEGNFHVMEPLLSCAEFSFAQKQIAVLTPGLCFDESGYRMGYGKGYYDRFFAQHPGLLKVGIAFEEQIAKEVITDSHDVPLDYLITEKRIIEIL